MQRVALLLLLFGLCGAFLNIDYDDLANLTSSSIEQDATTLRRAKRQEEIEVEPPPQLCNFGEGETLELCRWKNPKNVSSRLRWKTGKGSTAFWLGGPKTDHSKTDASGGYVFFETSYEGSTERKNVSSGLGSVPVQPETALLLSPNISQTGPQGLCLSFFYAMSGLSADGMTVLLWDLETGENSTLWRSSDGSSDGVWQTGEVAYTYGTLHKVMFQAVPKKSTDPSRSFRGYIALDDIEFQKMGENEKACLGHCTFEGSFCGWKNLEEEEDDFNWELARGSQSFLTGPSRDYSSFGKDEPTGGYVYIDASYPRRPGDSAMLISPEMTATGDNNPMCMRFATHMFGNGIGVLRVLQRTDSGNGNGTEDRIIWEISGEAGNNWHTAQVPVSSPSPFQLIFQSTVGSNSLGNIAIDNVSFRPGTCPISPQTASRNSGNCDFEEDTCSWNNPLPQDAVVDVDWARQYSFNIIGPSGDHTKGTPDGYYVTLLSNTKLPQRGGTRAWFISPQFQAARHPRCIAFYYYMYERSIDPAGPSLGSLRVSVRPSSRSSKANATPIWRLNNHQGQRWMAARAPIVLGSQRTPPSEPYQVVIEGIWGDGRVGHIAVDDISFFDGDCTTIPSKATAVRGECSFQEDMCGWQNGTSTQGNIVAVGRRTRPFTPQHQASEALTWRLASVTSRPANLQDHTFRAPTGYVFFDIFNQVSSQNPVLKSLEFESSQESTRCLSFWFAPFGRGESTTLSVVRVEPGTAPDEAGKRFVLWQLSTRKFDTSRPDWVYGQVAVTTETKYQVQFEGESSDGGFALDDITFYDGSCQVRPEQALVSTSVLADL